MINYFNNKIDYRKYLTKESREMLDVIERIEKIQHGDCSHWDLNVLDELNDIDMEINLFVKKALMIKLEQLLDEVIQNEYLKENEMSLLMKKGISLLR